MKVLKVDDHVVTADGTRGIIRYIGKTYDGTKYLDALSAEVHPYDGGDNITLPATELKRVPDPTRNRPPVEGIPEGPRPKCAFCHKPLPMLTFDEHNGVMGFGRRVTKRKFYRYGVDGVFCTNACGYRMGRAAVAAGYVMRPIAPAK